MISHPIHKNWAAQDPQVKELFGLDRKAKWPDEGMTTRQIQGVDCWVNALKPKVPHASMDWKMYRPFQLRAMCRCPQCGQSMAIGRLAQHEGTKTCTRRQNTGRI